MIPVLNTCLSMITDQCKEGSYKQNIWKYKYNFKSKFWCHAEVRHVKSSGVWQAGQEVVEIYPSCLSLTHKTHNFNIFSDSGIKRCWVLSALRVVMKCILQINNESSSVLVFSSICQSHLHIVSISPSLRCISEDLLSRQAVITISTRWLSSRWRTLLQIIIFFFLIIKVQVRRFTCHEENTVVNISQHGALILCVGGLNWLFLHLQEKQNQTAVLFWSKI